MIITKMGIRNIKKFFGLLLVVICILTYFLWTLIEVSHPIKAKKRIIEDVIYTPNLQDFGPDVPELRKILYDCPKAGPDLISVNFSKIYISDLEYIKYKQLRCYYYDHQWLELVTPVYLNEKFVHVKCTNSNNKVVYEDYLPLILSYKSYVPSRDRNAPNVLIFMLTGVSRYAFHRRMIKTHRVLKGLQAVEFTKVNALGHAPEENFMPLLSGESTGEWSFRNFKFLCHHFGSQGYTTVHAEDAHENLEGFLGFDYQWNLDNRIEQLYGSHWSQEHPFCLRNKKNHNVLFNYVKQIFLKTRNRPFFAFMVSNVARDAEEKLVAIDEDYSQALKELDNLGLLNNTFLLFLSDHGLQYGEIQFTNRGFLERMQPFAFLHCPFDFRRSYPTHFAHLTENRDVLLTNYEFYHGIKRLSRIRHFYDYTAEYNIFGKIPNRSCSEANIPAECCASIRGQLRTDSKAVRKATQFLIDTMNTLTLHTECVNLKLREIHDARYINNDSYYVISFFTKPGSGFFEGVVSEDEDEELKVVTIVRLTHYVRESSCVAIQNLKQFCFCTH